MAGVTHSKVSAKADGGDATLVLPSDWNASHANVGMVLLEQHTASASATLDFTTRNTTGQSGAIIQSDFDEYLFEMIDLLPATNAVELRMRASTGGVFDSSALYKTSGKTWVANGEALISSATTYFGTSNALDVSNTAGAGVIGVVRLYDPGSAKAYKQMTYDVGWIEGTPQPKHTVASCYYNNTTAVDGFQFYFSSGNVTSGIARCYGIAKS